MAAPRVADVLVDESTVTSRGQTTIPGSIRKALGLRPSDKIRFTLRSDNSVVISRSGPQEEHDDPVLGAFLGLIAEDVRANPGRVGAVPEDLLARGRELTDGVEFDLDAALHSDDE